MYISHYVFYKVEYNYPHAPRYYDIHVKEFTRPQEEHSYCREQRAKGYLTKQLNADMYQLLEAALSKAQ